jgi:hypothetical protein
MYGREERKRERQRERERERKRAREGDGKRHFRAAFSYLRLVAVSSMVIQSRADRRQRAEGVGGQERGSGGEGKTTLTSP